MHNRLYPIAWWPAHTLSLIAVFCVAVSLTGCVRMYVPSALNVGLLRGAGDVDASADAGAFGAQLSGAYALSDSVSARVATVASPTTSQPYAGIEGGLGAFYAPIHQDGSGRSTLPWRAGASVDVRAARALTGAVSLVGVAVQTQGGAEWEHGATAMVLRVSYLRMHHGIPPAVYGGDGRGVVAEPAVVVRAGTSSIKVQTQIGVSVPVWRRAYLGSQWPLLLSVGIAYEPVAVHASSAEGRSSVR